MASAGAYRLCGRVCTNETDTAADISLNDKFHKLTFAYLYPHTIREAEKLYNYR